MNPVNVIGKHRIELVLAVLVIISDKQWGWVILHVIIFLSTEYGKKRLVVKSTWFLF